MIEIDNATRIVPPEDCVPEKYWVRWFQLQRMFLLTLVLGTLGFVFSAQGLPDYDSYKRIYNSVSGYYFFGWEPFFVYLNYLGKYFLLNYDEFRSAILFLSLTNFATALYIFSRKLRGTVLQCRKQSMFFTILVELIFAFAFTIFFFEFFIIRIRAGLSLSMVFLAFSLFWPGKSKASKPMFLVIAILLCLAFATHLWTASSLVYFIFYPFALSLLYSKGSFARQGYFFRILLFHAVLIPAVLAFYVVLKMSVYRNRFSELNVFRLIALSVIPLIIAVFGVFSRRFVGLRSISKRQRSNSNSVLVHRTACQLMTWHYFATFSYVSMAFALLLFYMAGTVNQAGAGEAIVRLFTLSSPLAVFIVLYATRFYRGFWLFVLLSNSLFFVNTVFLSKL